MTEYGKVSLRDLTTHARDGESPDRRRLFLPDHRPSILLISDDDDDRALEVMAEAAEARLLGVASVETARERLDRTVDVDMLLLRCTRMTPALHALLVRVDAMAAMGDCALVVSTGIECLDLAYATVRAENAQLLCDPAPQELAAALVLSLIPRGATPQLWDISRDTESSRLEWLTQEVSRLAGMVDMLAGGPVARGPGEGRKPADRGGGHEATTNKAASPPATDVNIDTGHIRDILRVRRMRDQFFPDDLFADPAWDMLLDLMAARLAGEQVSVSSLCIAAAVPPTTALRWIRQLTERGLLVRQADPSDGRRVFIGLSEDAAASIRRWFAASRRILAATLGDAKKA